MTQKPISAAKPAAPSIRVAIVTLDGHFAAVAGRTTQALAAEIPGLRLSLHAAAEWAANPAALARCKAAIAEADVIVASMLFMDDHIQAVLPDLQARRDDCDAMLGCLSAGEVIKLTKLGDFAMDGEAKGPMALLKRLRGSKKKGASGGAKQMAMLRRLPKILRFIPGKAQDLRAYFLTLQYWLSGSEENFANMIRLLVGRYAAGPRAVYRDAVAPQDPIVYPETGLYHPRARDRVVERLDDLPAPPGDIRGTVGLLLMRSYVLAGDGAHYDAVIAALEAKGLRVVPAFAAGLDSRPAVDAYFRAEGETTIDALVSLTGFSLVGGPAYSDAKGAEETLAALDVPYVAAHGIEFQTLDGWEASDRGLTPVETTMMVAIPELDGATGPMVFGGRREAAEDGDPAMMRPHAERVERLAARVEKLVALRRTPAAERRVAITLFNFPPNAGAVGTAAFLSVFESLHVTLRAMRDAGYAVEVPEDVDALRAAILGDPADAEDAAIHTIVPLDDHVRREPHLADIEAQWGPAPGKALSDGRGIKILGARFGTVFVGVQPGFGYEGDPMRLLFEKGFAPTHAFSAYYRWVREDFAADAILHFGTHGALEFMPGKQSGLCAECWPDRLIGDVPNLYLYAANNPSEGQIAKRRSAATLVSYLTPSVTQAGLYRGLAELKASIDRWRRAAPDADAERATLKDVIAAQAEAVELTAPHAEDDVDAWVGALADALHEMEHALIPDGLHVVGSPMGTDARIDSLLAVADASHGAQPARASVAALVAGANSRSASMDAALHAALKAVDDQLKDNRELDALLHALDGRFIRPSPAGDLIRTPDILPTGRNLHGFDPFRLPSAAALADGGRQADLLLDRHRAESGVDPETVAIVLWGSDNLKTEGGPIAQALALIGAAPRFDSYGRLCGATLLPLEDLRRPRIDVVMTLSGIFRDLLPLQTRLLAEAALLAATADEPEDMNFVAKHARARAAETGCDLETAALRVFSNADGAYGSNVAGLIDSSAWDDDDELAETYSRRKCFAYRPDGRTEKQPDLLNAIFAKVDLAYQNLESVELGVTTIDHYFDTLGGISRSVARAKGGDEPPVYIGDQTRGEGTVRTLGEQVALETRTRALNPKWFEGMLAHGYEGVRHIEAQVTNTMGWSATTGQVQPWVYQQLTETFVLDDAMRRRLAALNPAASAKVANRLIEAHERNYWTPDAETLAALQSAGEELEDQLEGVGPDQASPKHAPMEAAE